MNARYTSAVGIQYPSAGDRLIVFQPNIERTLDFVLLNAEHIHSYKTAGVLDDYVTIIDPAQDSGARQITADIKMPATLDPGIYTIMIGGAEMGNVGGTVGALTAVQSKVTVLSLYPDAYPEFSLSVGDISINQSTEYYVTVHNYGMKRINAAQAFISIYDPDNNLVTTLATDTQPVEIKLDDPVISTALKAVFNTSQYILKPGIYRAVAKLVYDTIEMPDTKEGTFRVGTLNVYVTDWTRSVFVNSTNKFQVMITSDWSSPIDNVYARITTPNKGILKTPNLDMNKFSEATLETYWETDGLTLGEHNLTIEIFYQGQSSKQIVSVNITEGIPPVVEKPAGPSMNISLDATTIVLILTIIILAFNVYLFMFKGRGKQNASVQPPNNDYANNTTTDNATGNVVNNKQVNKNSSIRPPRL